MKKRYFFLFLVACSIFLAPVSAQRVCNQPISNYAFNQKYNAITQAPEVQRLAIAQRIARNNCLSVDHVKQVLAIFADDYQRLEFAKTAYHNTVDKVNFYEVYDSFAYFSTVFRLHDFVVKMREFPAPQPPQPDPTPPVIAFPNYNYPSVAQYQGPTSCDLPLANADFNIMVVRVAEKNSDEGRMIAGDQLAKDQCLCTAQMMKLASLLQLESNRLAFLQHNYQFTYDLGNYAAATQVFGHVPNQNALLNFIKGQQVPTEPIPVEEPPCRVTPGDYQQIKTSIQKQTFNNTRLTLAKQIIRSKQCFTTHQMIGIVRLFEFESGKLEIAKYGYDFVVDKNNYYRMNDAFEFDSSTRSLDQYIQSKGR